MTQTLEIPAVGRARAVRVPTHGERRLPNGLRAVAVRKATIPRVEMRLRIPAGPVHDTGDGARASMLSETLIAGTAHRTSVDIAQALQRVGASLDVTADSDDLVLYGGAIAPSLPALLEILAEVLTEAAFPADEVAIARERLAQEIVIQRAQSSALASEALRARLFGKHRYGRPIPSPDAMRRIGRAPVERFHRARVLPRGATLLLAGDLRVEPALDAAAAALSGWRGTAQGNPSAKPAVPASARPAVLIDRPGSVQTTIRIAGPGLPRTDPAYLDLALAITIFGGYFSSRLTKNIREDKGYTYSPGARPDHRRFASTWGIHAEVGTEVTAPALNEIRYELGRMTSLPVPQDELDQARRYLAGSTALQIHTVAGLTGYVDGLLSSGQGIDHLRNFTRELAAITPERVQDAARRFLAPGRLQTVLVGDAARIRADVEALGELSVSSGQD